MVNLQKSVKNIFSSIDLGNEELSPVDWIERHRYVQQHVSERMFGKFDFSNSPYMRKLTNYLSPYSEITHCVLMKGVRIGGTFSLVHNGVPYVISERPTNILLLSANKGLAKKTLQGVDDGIDGCNIRNLLGKRSGIKTNTTGDTTESKTFSGGFELVNFGGQAINNMKQITAGLIIADEVDAYTLNDKKFGSFTEVMEDRAFSLGDAKKIFYLGSPGLMDTSLIYKLYLEGDQQIFLVPCPKCGDYMELVWNERNENNTRYGIIFDIKNGEVVKNSVRYRCGNCENDWSEDYKDEILDAGDWKATVKREDTTFASHRLNTLYAPTSMSGWYDIAKVYQKAFPRTGIKDDAKYHSFVNSYQGLPYKEEGQVLKSNKLQQNRREYKIGECPFELSKKDNNGEIMLISIACDLNGYQNDGRIDYAIVAHSEKGATYNVDAGSVGTFIPKIEKEALTKDGVNVPKLESSRIKYTYKHGVENSIWDGFEEIVLQKFGKIQRSIDILAVDVGFEKDYALEFVFKIRKRGIYCIGVKGDKQENFQSQDKTEYGSIYKKSSYSDYFLLNVNVIKDRLAKYIECNSYIDDEDQLRQESNFMNFPERDAKSSKYTYRNFFAHYEAEQKLRKVTDSGDVKFIWEKKKTIIQNHFFDVEVYNIFCRILMTDVICSNENPYKVRNYKTQKIEQTWINTCLLIKEASQENNIPLS